MNEEEIFKSAVRVMEKAIKDLLADHKYKISDVDHVIPHQANVRIVEVWPKDLKFRWKSFCNLDRHGNTSAASIPLALDEAIRKNIFNEGDLAVHCLRSKA